jgi:hypothetical protein
VETEKNGAFSPLARTVTEFIKQHGSALLTKMLLGVTGGWPQNRIVDAAQTFESFLQLEKEVTQLVFVETLRAWPKPMEEAKKTQFIQAMLNHRDIRDIKEALRNFDEDNLKS